MKKTRVNKRINKIAKKIDKLELKIVHLKEKKYWYKVKLDIEGLDEKRLQQNEETD